VRGDAGAATGLVTQSTGSGLFSVLGAQMRAVATSRATAPFPASVCAFVSSMMARRVLCAPRSLSVVKSWRWV